MANSVDPDQMPHFAASDLGLLCLLGSACPNTLGLYGIHRSRTPSRGFANAQADVSLLKAFVKWYIFSGSHSWFSLL